MKLYATDKRLNSQPEKLQCGLTMLENKCSTTLTVLMPTTGFGLAGSFFGVTDEPIRVYPQHNIHQRHHRITRFLGLASIDDRAVINS